MCFWENVWSTAAKYTYNNVQVPENSEVGTKIAWRYAGKTNPATIPTSFLGEITDEDNGDFFVCLI